MILLLLKVVSQISTFQIEKDVHGDYFQLFITDLLNLFDTDRKLLDTRGSFIIRQLSLCLDGAMIYTAFAQELATEEDAEMVYIMVQKLNMILFTSPELHSVRVMLRDLTVKENKRLFCTLYNT